MKIGQVTMYGDNYGACLQAFALQQYAKKMGAEIELIRYHQTDRNSVSPIMDKLKTVWRLGVRGTIAHFRNRLFIASRKEAFSDFRDKYIKFSQKEYWRDSNLIELNDIYDRFICGSDMIWSEEFLDDWRFFFLGFADYEKSCSYAPSFGRNEMSNENKKIVFDYLSGIRMLSCREQGGCDLIKSIFGMDSVQVIDPTLLLGREEWEGLIENRNRIISEPYVFTYLFGNKDIGRIKLIERVNEEIGKTYSIPMNLKEKAEFPMEAEVGPIEFMSLFRDAGFIITDTFHGLMFSILFEKPFIVLKRNDDSKWAKYSDRMTSTMKMLGVLNRYVDSDFQDFDRVKNFEDDEYREKLKKLRSFSRDYLNLVIKG